MNFIFHRLQICVDWLIVKQVKENKLVQYKVHKAFKNCLILQDYETFIKNNYHLDILFLWLIESKIHIILKMNQKPSTVIFCAMTTTGQVVAL